MLVNKDLNNSTTVSLSYSGFSPGGTDSPTPSPSRTPSPSPL